MVFGWMGKILRVDLSTGQIAEEDLQDNVRTTWLGGRGLGASILFKEVPANCDALGPENKLIFATGPLTGTRVPTSGRFSVTTKSPLTGTIFDSNAGGVWGVRFKRCGYDALIIEGESPKPVYLSITDDGAAICDAGHLWGLDVHAASSRLEAESGRGVSVACIGPAGERMVKMAAIINDRHRALGRGGVGAVMGAKKLKAVAVGGSKKVPVAEPDQLDFVVYETNKWLKANPITSQGLPEFGTAVLVNLFNELGVFPARNFQQSYFSDALNICGETLAETITVKRRGCYGCPIQCARVTRAGSEEGEGPEYESIWALGPQCGIGDLEVIARANYLCNRLGLDTISTGVTIGCAMELREKGIFSSGPTFEDARALLETIKKIAFREGIGDLLAEGADRFAGGLGAPEYAMQVKGLELPAYDPRGLQGMGLGFATSNRGACHLRAYMVGPEVLGVPKMVDRFATGGKAGLTIVQQNVSAAVDSLIICRFAGLAVSEEYFVRLLSAVVGIKYQTQDLHVIGERIWNLERLYNLRAGFGARDDTLPGRLLHQPVAEGPSRGCTVKLDEMLGEYYRFRGWDQSGAPTAKKLRSLGLEEII